MHAGAILKPLYPPIYGYFYLPIMPILNFYPFLTIILFLMNYGRARMRFKAGKIKNRYSDMPDFA